ncbi:hypothetical protein MF494_001970 [Campylobacter coli]|nr:hypothetical protein [Campylobacter coli]
MTEIQFNEIKERLADWRSERGLTYENQSYNPYGNEVKNNNNEKYIEIGDDDENLPF